MSTYWGNPNNLRRHYQSRPFNPEASQQREVQFAESQDSTRRAVRRAKYHDAKLGHDETSHFIDRVVVLDGAERRKAEAQGRSARIRPLSKKHQQVRAKLMLVNPKDLKPRPKR